MATELDRIAKKQAKQKIDKAQKKLNIKQHNIKAAIKADKADPEEQGLFGSKRHFKLAKKLKQAEKSEKFLDTQDEKVGQGKSYITDVEKNKLIEKGFPSKAKFAGGGTALRGLGRAFMKGGKV